MDQFKVFDRVYLEATGRGYVDELKTVWPQPDHQRYIEWLVNSGRFWVYLASRDFIEAIYEYFQDLDEQNADKEDFKPIIGEAEDVDDFHKRVITSPSPIMAILAPAFQIPENLPAPAPSITEGSEE